MTDNHPITPPPEIIREWQIKIEYCSKRADREAIVAKIFQLGADMELEACCEWLKGTAHIGIDFELINARRPTPPSLKEQALQELERTVTLLMPVTGPNKVERFAIIRRALESLPD